MRLLYSYLDFGSEEAAPADARQRQTETNKRLVATEIIPQDIVSEKFGIWL
jgi:hypothetical protein